MKIFVISILLFSINILFSQEASNEFFAPCEEKYILNYREIYDDTISDTQLFIETYLEKRFSYVYLDYMDSINGPETDPYRFYLDVVHPLYPEELMLIQVCNLEKMSAEGDLLIKLEEYIKKQR